jgi:hypothetical protein
MEAKRGEQPKDLTVYDSAKRAVIDREFTDIGCFHFKEIRSITRIFRITGSSKKM